MYIHNNDNMIAVYIRNYYSLNLHENSVGLSILHQHQMKGYPIQCLFRHVENLLQKAESLGCPCNARKKAGELALQ